MRHRKRTFKLGRNSSHRRCMMANMIKSLIEHGKIETSVRKGKELKRQADSIITLAKKGDLASLRRIKAKLMIRFNKLSSKERRSVKEGSTAPLNGDRKVFRKLFSEVPQRFMDRPGGYTSLVRTSFRRGDSSERCIVSLVAPSSAVAAEPEQSKQVS
ncbi:50S ribosomal protein L17 [Candidatus Aerophobetes bacterium]|uniref:50S ribosomal protein L17 n=1 Tax=Aerophobetes bacterium TaxID=2030807 RepID=A0A2A4X8L0_UNCAE|nr:MAG: 50S ribosomal protein L17 [Candidatus Aerophobetes bacterium]